MSKFSNLVSDTLASLGLTQKDFAEKAKISTKTLTEILSGEFDRILNKPDDLSLRKRAGIMEVMTRCLHFCGKEEELEGCLDDFGITLSHSDRKIIERVRQNLQDLDDDFLNNPLTEEDLKKLEEVRKSVDSFLTIRLALDLLRHLHGKNTNAPSEETS